MTASIRRTTWASALGLAALLLVATACGSDGGGNLPSVTVPDISVPDVSAPDVSIPEVTTTSRQTTTTTAEPTTTTTERPPITAPDRSTTTTTDQPTTTTTEKSTTTTEKSTTTTTNDNEVAAGTTTTTTATTTDDSGTSPWLWVLLLALLVGLGTLIWLLMRSRKGAAAAAQWAARSRDLARQTQAVTANLDRAVVALEGPTPGDRQVWLTSAQQLSAIESSAAAMLPDVPPVPGDPAGTNSAAASLDSLRSNAAVCRSAVTDAERTGFELIGPTAEQLAFAAATVRRSSSALAADANALSTAADRIAPPPAPTA